DDRSAVLVEAVDDRLYDRAGVGRERAGVAGQQQAGCVAVGRQVARRRPVLAGGRVFFVDGERFGAEDLLVAGLPVAVARQVDRAGGERLEDVRSPDHGRFAAVPVGAVHVAAPAAFRRVVGEVAASRLGVGRADRI